MGINTTFTGVGNPSFTMGGDSTPSSAVFTPNTNLNIAYGGRSQVGTGKFTSSPSTVNYNPIYGTTGGGTSFNPNIAPAFNNSNTNTQSSNTQSSNTQNTDKPDLSKYLIAQYTTTSGGNLSTDGSGQPIGYTPSGFAINSDGTIDSTHMRSNLTSGDINNQQKQYQDYVNAVSQAQGYSPSYLSALQQQYQTQAQGSYLGTQQANLNANLATGQGFTGYSTDQAGAKTGIEQNLLAQQQALNTQQATQAAINLNTQQLARTGQISAAQTQLQYNPTAITGQNAIAQWQQYSQNYPGIVPAYDQSKSPSDNALIAQQAVQNSPQFKSQFQQTYQTPGGGLGIYNKLGTNLLRTNADGTINLVTGAEASLGSANANAIGKLTDQYNTLKIPFDAANNDFTAMTNFMQAAHLNNSSVPLINQIDNAVKAGILQPGIVKEFGTYIQSLRANYGALLQAKGETPTDAGNAAGQLVPDNLSISDLMKVKDGLNINGQNILNATQQQLQNMSTQLQNNNIVPSTQDNVPQTQNNNTAWPGWNGQ